MTTKNTVEKLIKAVLSGMSIEDTSFSVEYPDDISHGDYATNVAMVLGKKLGKNPKDLAGEIAEALNKVPGNMFEKVEVAGPGFINFYLSKEFFKEALSYIIDKGDEFGKGEHAKGMKVMVEHTDPNPFKEFHIGHLMPNVIGSAIARIFEWNGAEVKQANYQGDKGLHVAKAVYVFADFLESVRETSPKSKIEDIQFAWPELVRGMAYASGNKYYEERSDVKAWITEINKQIYDESNEDINYIYRKGKKESLAYFEEIYKKLGAKFDYYFFESETAQVGKKIVEENIGKVFEESDGAVVFKGENFNPSLHTRVFINSQGIPTYEAKDLGNAKSKFDKYPYDLSVVVTGNEIKDYFRVVLEAMKQVLPELAKKTKHLPHGMLRLTTGKMSSRTGDVITAESLIEDVSERVMRVMERADKTSGPALSKEVAEMVAIGAIKYMVLRSNIGSDIIFDFEKSVSTEGDSGVYLQYAHARANSIMEKAGKRGSVEVERVATHNIERILHRFPEIIERAGTEYSPSYITTYITELAGSFNNFYANEPVLTDSPQSAYRLAIVEAFKTVMKNGLTVLGIPAPERM